MSSTAAQGARASRRTTVVVLWAVTLVIGLGAVWGESRVQAGEPAVVAVSHGLLALAAVGWAAVGAVVAWYRPENPMGWFLLLVGATAQVGVSGDVLARAGAFGPVADPALAWAGNPAGVLVSAVGGFGTFLLFGLLPVLYPSGRPARSAVGPAVLVCVGAALMEVQWAAAQVGASDDWPLDAEPGSSAPLVQWAPSILYAVGVLWAWTACIVRLVRARPPERQQLACLLVAVAVAGGCAMLGSSTPALVAQTISLYLVPVAVLVGILRYRLLGIQLVLRRAIVYGLLTGAVIAVHGVAVLLGGAGLAGAPPLPGVIAAAVVAVGLTPLRDRLQRWVDHLLYGTRTDPLRAVTVVGGRVAGAGPHDLLDAVLDGVRDAVRASGAWIVGPDGEPVGERGAGREGGALRVPLTVGGAGVGILHVAARGRGERYSDQDEQLVGAIAPQVAVVVRALELAEALERERDEVLRVRFAERERLRADLHDGLGPSLTGIALGLQALDDDALGDARGRELRAVLRAEVAAAVTEIRRILDDLRPAPVAELGLGGALVRAARSMVTLPVDVTVPPGLRLTPAVEDTVYRVALEALTNVVRHADASTAQIRVQLDDDGVVLTVSDDGTGVGDDDERRGLGLSSMGRRAQGVGGTLTVERSSPGTTVTLRVPVGVTTAVAHRLTEVTT